jgi:hypothetical protein
LGGNDELPGAGQTESAKEQNDSQTRLKEDTKTHDDSVSRLTPKPGTPWENNLGMKFVPVPDTAVLFCIWETRVQDYAAFAAANPKADNSWQNAKMRGREKAIPVSDGPMHPVVNVSWADAQAFCAWLTMKEREERHIAEGSVTACLLTVSGVPQPGSLAKSVPLTQSAMPKRICSTIL